MRKELALNKQYFYDKAPKSHLQLGCEVREVINQCNQGALERARERMNLTLQFSGQAGPNNRNGKSKFMSARMSNTPMAR